jgi:hypothetical protein
MVGRRPTAKQDEEENMTQEITQEQKQEALRLIAEQVKIAEEALAKAEQLAKEAQVGFDFTFDGITGSYYTHKYGATGAVAGYYDGWEGSSC